MTTPLSLRLSRLLLAAAAAGAIGSAAIILSRTASPIATGPILLVFTGVAALFVAAARRLEPEPAAGRLLACAAAFALGGLAVLTGFGAGDVTFPAAALGVAAAWATLLRPPRRAAVVALAAYVGIGTLVVALRPGSALLSLQISTVLLWPWILAFATTALTYLPLVASFLLAVGALLAYDVRRRRPGIALPGRWAAAGAAVGGTLGIAAYVAAAFARESTSARFELEGLPLALAFSAGALAGAGLASAARSGGATLPAGAVVFGLALFGFAVSRSASVECSPSGVGVGGAWWRPLGSAVVSGSHNVSAGGAATGEAVAGDRRLTYRCEAGRLVEFRIERVAP